MPALFQKPLEQLSWRIRPLAPYVSDPLTVPQNFPTGMRFGSGIAARDFGDSVRRKLVENADAHLNGLRQRRPDTEAVRSASRDERFTDSSLT
jgi:hypothetical protein